MTFRHPGIYRLFVILTALSALALAWLVCHAERGLAWPWGSL